MTDDPLARAEAALRDAPVPAGPPDETVARTLAALSAAQGPPRKRRRIVTLTALAAALAAAVGLLQVFPAAQPLAFAEVAAHFRDAKTLTSTHEMYLPGRDKPATQRAYQKGPNLSRFEGPGTVIVIDSAAGKTLVLDTAGKTALLTESKPAAGDGGAAQLADRLRKLAALPGEPAGKMTFDGVEVQGFRAKDDGRDVTVWADPTTKLPVRVEVATKEVRFVVKDIRFDPPLDDGLFKLGPPAGYRLREQADPADGVEADVARLLKAYTDRSGGEFPAELFNPHAWDKEFAKRKPAGPADPELAATVQSLVRLTIWQKVYKGESGYDPKGAKLGDKARVVFWYRPEGADKYRAVFADLSVGDAAVGQLPRR